MALRLLLAPVIQPFKTNMSGLSTELDINVSIRGIAAPRFIWPCTFLHSVCPSSVSKYSCFAIPLNNGKACDPVESTNITLGHSKSPTEKKHAECHGAETEASK